MSADYHGSRDRCVLPDNIVGIGSAGKRVVDHYLSQDWILEQGVAEFSSGGVPPGFDAYFVDTESHSREFDVSRVHEHNERIEAIAEQSGRDPGTVTTGVEYINPVEDTPDHLLSRAGLTEAATVKEIAENAGLDAWWLEDDDAMLNDGYDHGLLRRRGLGKAIFHASRVDDGRMATLPADLDGSTAIVAGLGGGTGAGMAIDLAKRMENHEQVNLIATLPALDEQDRSKANAYAALSELEYLALREQNPFTNVLLVPFAPASDLDDHTGFLDGVAKAIVARENLVAVDRFDESAPGRLPPAFAPFTVAVPQTLRYTIGDVREAARALREYRDEKREALAAELDFYRGLREFLIEEWGGDVGEALEAAQNGLHGADDDFRLDEGDAYLLRDRIEDLEAWLGDEALDSLDNKAIHDWRDQLSAWRDAIGDAVGDRPTEEFVAELTARLRSRVETLEPPEDRYPAEPDERELDSLVREEIRAIALRADLLRAGRLIEAGDSDAEPVGTAITAAMDPGRDAWVAARDLEDESDRFARDINAVESDLDTLDDLEADLAERRDEAVDSWHDAVGDDVEALVEIDARSDEIYSRLEDLEREIEDAVRAIDSAVSPDELPNQLFDFDFARLNDALEAVGLESIDPDAVRRSVELTATAFEAWDAYRNAGLVGRIFNRQEEAENRYLQAIVGIDDRYVTVVPSTNGDLEAEDFRCESVAGERFDRIRDHLAEERARHIDAIVWEFDRTLSEVDGSAAFDSYRDRWAGDRIEMTWPGVIEDAPEQLHHRLESGFESNTVHAAFDELLAPGRGSDSPGLVHEALHEAYLGPVERQRDELEATLETLESHRERYELLREILKDLGDRFDALDPERPDFEKVVAPGDRTDDPYLTLTAAEDRSGLLQYEDLAASLVWDDDDSVEMRKIRSHFRQFAEKVGRNGDLAGLQDGRIELLGNGDGDYADARNSVYGGHSVCNIFMSRTFETDHADPDHPTFEEADEELYLSQLHFGGDANGYHSQSLGCGGPWDLSMVTFVGGVFLDNIRGIDRYGEAYESQRSELGDAVRIRHTHGLDGTDPTLGDVGEGGYVYRESLLDLNDPDDVYTLLDSSQGEMVETLLEDYVGRETFESTVDLG